MKIKSTSLLVVSVLAGMALLASCGGGSSESKGAGSSSVSTGGSDPLGSSQAGGASSSSSTGEITKSAALQILADINTAHSAAGFKAPTGAIITNKTKMVSLRNITKTTTPDYTFYAIYSADVTDKSGAVTVKKETFVGTYYNGEGKFCAIKNVDDVITVVVDDAAGTLKTAADAKMTSYLAKATYASAFAKYLGNFNEDGSAITGGTAKDATLKAQKYVSTGAGNLSIDITANYGYDEAISYKWDNNLLVYAKSSDTISYDWKLDNGLTPDDDGATISTDITVGTAIIDLM